MKQLDKTFFFILRDILEEFKRKGIIIGKLIIIGARGIGKSYSSLSYPVEENIRFMYMRNTWTQIKECATEFGNPFKRLNIDKGWNIRIEIEKDHGLIMDYSDNDNVKCLGYACDLATFNDLKGVDLSDVDLIFFDEFSEVRKLMFDQFEAFQRMYETVNRSRELFGRPPLLVVLASNSDSLANPILMGYNLVPLIEGMIKSGQTKLKVNDIYLMMPKAKISELKAKTTHYQGLKGTKAYENAINNEFAYDSQYGIHKRKLVEYKPLVMIDDIYIYKHKSQNKYYACSSQFTNMPEFTSKDNKLAFYRAYGRSLSLACATGQLEFSDFVIKTKLSKILL